MPSIWTTSFASIKGWANISEGVTENLSKVKPEQKGGTSGKLERSSLVKTKY